MNNRAWAIVVIGILAMGLAGCRARPSGPVIKSFKASAAVISPGDSVTLNWEVSGPATLNINHGVGTVTGTSVSVKPTRSMSYTLTAADAAGKSVRSSVTLVVLDCNRLALCREIHEAAASPGLEKVKTLVKDKPDLASSKDNNGVTPLHAAAASGRKDAADFLLACNVDPNAKDARGETPLHFAAHWGSKDVAELLLTHKAEVNAGDNIGLTPLHSAAWWGHRGAAELLLAHQADANAKTECGLTPLHLAASGNYSEVVELLLAHGAGINAKDSDGVTPLHVAAEGGHKGVAELMLAHGAEANAKDSNGVTPLHLASAGGYRNVAELLLAHGAEINTKDHDGATPLHEAAAAGHRDMAEWLLAHQAEVNATDSSGATPLHEAASAGHQDVVELLRQHGGEQAACPLQLTVNTMDVSNKFLAYVGGGANISPPEPFGGGEGIPSISISNGTTFLAGIIRSNDEKAKLLKITFTAANPTAQAYSFKIGDVALTVGTNRSNDFAAVGYESRLCAMSDADRQKVKRIVVGVPSHGARSLSFAFSLASPDAKRGELAIANSTPVPFEISGTPSR